MPPKKAKEAAAKDATKGSKDKKNKKSGKPAAVSLADENVRLTEELVAAKAQMSGVNKKWESIGKQMLEGLREIWKQEHNIIEDPSFLSEDQWSEIIEHLVVKKKLFEDSAESLVERLEKRVTQLNLDLARLTQKCAAYEQGLKYVSNCECIDDVRDRVYGLRIIAGESFHCFEASDTTRNPKDLFSILGITDRESEDVKRVIQDANCLDLLPPACLYPGHTLVLDMLPELLLYLIKELSLEKVSGGDWRALGVRVGLHESIIDDWWQAGLQYPAGRVLDEWLKVCPTASVRLLYRHLMSPALRCTVLCRRIADFYNVC